MATYAANLPPHAGAQLTFTSPPANNDIAPTGSQLSLLVVNPPANGTVTVSLPALTVDGQTVTARVLTVLQGTSGLIPLLPATYGPSVQLTYTGTLATVQVAIIGTPGN